MPARRPTFPLAAERVGESLPPARWHPAPLERARRSPAATRWAVAFSGGADSLALLFLLWTHFPARREKLLVLHFNHALRGRASDADARFCARVCAQLGVEFVTEKWVRPAPKNAVTEAAARAARHAFFARAMKRRRIRLLWLAHQQDDIAETQLMRLARGSGTAGLAAPRPVQATADGRTHLRPLLTLRKSGIVAALRTAGATWREDASNASGRFLRNRIRHEIIPAWTGVVGRDALAGAALARERLAEDDEALEAWLDELKVLARRGRELRVGALAGRPAALWRRALHRWLLRVRPDTDLSRQGFEQLLAALRRGADTRFSLGQRHFAVLEAGLLRLRAH